MRTTVCKWNARNPGENTVYIGRPTKWGNPFVIGKDGNREQVILKYQLWIQHPERKHLRNQARCELRGKRLACFCFPLQCHGFVLAAIADSPIEN